MSEKIEQGKRGCREDCAKLQFFSELQILMGHLITLRILISLVYASWINLDFECVDNQFVTIEQYTHH